MPNYRRPKIAGATWFITITTFKRRPLFRDDEIVMRWREALAQSKQEKSFEIIAGVVLPDHVHLLVSLPPDDEDISSRIGRAKALFTKSLPNRAATKTRSRQKHREADVWQRRFYDHVIRDEIEFELYFDYIHYNPVKHGYVRCPHEWRHSSFHLWVRRGVYTADWACFDVRPLPDFSRIEENVGEP